MIEQRVRADEVIPGDVLVLHNISGTHARMRVGRVELIEVVLEYPERGVRHRFPAVRIFASSGTGAGSLDYAPDITVAILRPASANM